MRDTSSIPELTLSKRHYGTSPLRTAAARHRTQGQPCTVHLSSATPVQPALGQPQGVRRSGRSKAVLYPVQEPVSSRPRRHNGCCNTV